MKINIIINYINCLLRTLREDLQTTENKKREAVAAYNAVNEKVKRTNSELSNVSATVRKLKSAQNEYANSINDLKDKIDSSEATSADVFVSNQNRFSIR